MGFRFHFWALSFTSFFFSLSLLVSLVACESQEEKERMAAAKGGMQAMRPSDGGVKILRKMSPFPTESLMAKDIKKPELKSLPAASGPVKLRWSFNTPKTFRYNYELKVNSKHRAYDQAGEQEIKVKALVEMESLGGGQAKLILRDVSGTTEERKEGQEKTVTPFSDFPSSETPGVTEDSVVTGTSKSVLGNILPMIFPLPLEEVSIGSKAEVGLRFPLNALDFKKDVKGYTDLTLVEFVEAGGHRCALMEVVFAIDQADIQSTVPGKVGLILKGKGWLVFDTVDGCFHFGELAMMVGIRARLDAPKNNAKRVEVPKHVMAEIDSDSWFRFQRTTETPASDKPAIEKDQAESKKPMHKMTPMTPEDPKPQKKE